MVAIHVPDRGDGSQDGGEAYFAKSLALWIFFSCLIGFASELAADVVAPVNNERKPEQVVANRRAAEAAHLASPVILSSQATSTILDPFRRTRTNLVLVGPMESFSLERFRNPLPLDQSLLAASAGWSACAVQPKRR